MKMTPEFSILISDDSIVVLEVLHQILEPYYIIYTAKSGSEALAKATECKPDLILLDIIMPDMSGLNVLTELKKSNITVNIPVIFITGLDSVEDEEKGLLLGAVDYISKPFHASIVKARVKTHLEIVRQMRAIERFGMIDSLTNIPNRRSFDNQLTIEWSRAIRKQVPISAFMIDVDMFKNYNDSYGHPQGDMLLQTLANLFTSKLKNVTDLTFRWGGDEFFVLLPDFDSESALKLAEDLRSSVESLKIPVSYTTNTFITISVGVISATPSSNGEAAKFISGVDKALYTAKHEGRNRVCAYQNNIIKQHY